MTSHDTQLSSGGRHLITLSVVMLPEWADDYVMPVGDGDTYEDALASARDALVTFIEHAREDGRPPPEPRVHMAASA